MSFRQDVSRNPFIFLVNRCMEGIVRPASFFLAKPWLPHKRHSHCKFYEGAALCTCNEHCRRRPLPPGVQKKRLTGLLKRAPFQRPAKIPAAGRAGRGDLPDGPTSALDRQCRGHTGRAAVIFLVIIPTAWEKSRPSPRSQAPPGNAASPVLQCSW